MLYVAIAGAIGGAITGALGVKATGFALPSFLSIPVFTPMSQFLIGTLTALILTMVLTLVFGYESKNAIKSNKTDKVIDESRFCKKVRKYFSPSFDG